MKTILLLIFSILFLSSCAVVHQIDRDKLSKRIMQFEPDPNKQLMINDFHSIREGASGGTGQSAGGGCGCN